MLTAYQTEVYNSAKQKFLSSDSTTQQRLLSELRIKNAFYSDRLGTIELSDPQHKEYVEVGKLFLQEFDGTKS